MEAKEVKITDVLSCKEIPIIRVKYYEKNAFIMGFHVYKAALTPSIEEMLSGVMEASNVMDKYPVAVFGEEKTSSGASSLAKFRKICQDNFLLLESRQKLFLQGKCDWKGCKHWRWSGDESSL